MPDTSSKSTLSHRLTGQTLSGVRAQSLRAANLSLVLRHVLENPGTTRAKAAYHSHITRATASRLVDELIDVGLLCELDPLSPARGRPAVPLAPTAHRFLSLGLEVNIGYLRACVVDLAGNVLAEEVRSDDYSDSDPSATISELGDLARGALERVTAHAPASSRYLGSGLALPGLVSAEALALAPNLGWRDIPLSQLLAPVLDLDVGIVANEADLAAFAVDNPRPGVPSGPGSFIYVSGEVGIGAGILVGHRQVRGAHGWSGEIGHICVDPAGPRCSCGATGCLEAYLGRRSLVQQAGLEPRNTLADVLTAANEGLIDAQRALEVGGAALGRALAAVINTVDIPLVVLGGNVADIAPALVEPARHELETRVLQSAWSHPEIRVVEHSEHLASLGAAHRVLQRLVDDPLAWTS